MEIRANLKSIVSDWASGRFNVTFEITEGSIEDIQALSGKDLLLAIELFKKRRSLNANALMWKCLDTIARSIKSTKWDVYLAMLKRYGVFTMVTVKAQDVERIKKQWRETEVVGDSYYNDMGKVVDVMCYFGSHTYTTEEFAFLLDGIISEMKEMGIPTPASKEMQRSLEQWEKSHSQS